MGQFEHLKMEGLSNQVTIDNIQDDFLLTRDIRLDLLRLDLIHPQISGNKWFKLKYNIETALTQGAESILSFGGAYSNHLHALAYAGHVSGIKTIGILRGEEVSNHTLDDCRAWGMALHFISREAYRHKNESDFLESIQAKFPASYIVPEGGNNEAGRKGTREILQGIDLNLYTHICCAVGTGATLAGIADSALPQQKVWGFSAIKNGSYLEEEIKQYTGKSNWTLLHDYHFGGFAKKNEQLLEFMEGFRKKHQIELDVVYTGKMVAGIYQMIQATKMHAGSSVLVIHTGGLQGNRSLHNER